MYFSPISVSVSCMEAAAKTVNSTSSVFPPPQAVRAAAVSSASSKLIHLFIITFSFDPWVFERINIL